MERALNIGYVAVGLTSLTIGSVLSVVEKRVCRVLMKTLDERTTANMEVALEQVCRVLLHGGDHKTRKRIARKLMHSARHGNTTLGDFMAVRANRARRNLF